MEILAHSQNDEGKVQPLMEHLTNTAALAAAFAGKWDAAEWGKAAGLYHDIGKISEQFQGYLRKLCSRGGDHAILGALATKFAPLTFSIAGHHTGLSDMADLKARIANADSAKELLERYHKILPELDDIKELPMPHGMETDRGAVAVFTRMLFSALVNADFLD